MVSTFIFRLGGLGLSPGYGHCIVSLSKTLHFTLTVPLSTGELNTGGNFEMDKHPIQEEIEILLVTSCYSNRLWPNRSPWLVCRLNLALSYI